MQELAMVEAERWSCVSIPGKFLLISPKLPWAEHTDWMNSILYIRFYLVSNSFHDSHPYQEISLQKLETGICTLVSLREDEKRSSSLLYRCIYTTANSNRSLSTHNRFHLAYPCCKHWVSTTVLVLYHKILSAWQRNAFPH